MRNDRSMKFLTLMLAVFASGALSAAPPENQPPLIDTLDSDNDLYRLRYDRISSSTHYMPASSIYKAADALDRIGVEDVGNPLGYHDGYLDLGLAAPWFSGNPSINDVTFWDCDDPADPDDFDCDNGFATVEQIVMPSPTYRGRSESCVRMILGHELFHHVEFGYVNAGGGSGCGKVFGSTACEGQARAMQDKIYFDLDLDPAASCIASFNGQAKTYLNDPDLTIWKSSYSSALFWTYLMEQYGTIEEEPNRGADFITAWWELATDEVADPNVYDITERAIKLFAPTHSLVNAYQDFTIANLVKDLNVLALPASAHARYTYDDDEPVLGQTNLQKISKVDVDFFADVPANGAASIQLQAQRFGGDYSSFNLSACPAGRQVEFSVAAPFLLPLNPNIQTPAPDALISLVLTKGADGRSPSKLYKWRGKSVKKSFMQPTFEPYTRGFVIVSGWHGTYPGVLTMRCLPAPLQPQVKFAGQQAQPGPSPQPMGSISVGLPSGATGNAPIAGLNVGDFNVRIGTQTAPIRAAVRDGDGYRLHFAHPTQTGPGPFSISVQAGAQTTTVANAIRYDQPDPSVMVVLDLSASMGNPPATALLLPAVQKIREAANRMRSTARFGIVGHFGNGSEPGRDATVLLPLAPLDASQRAALDVVLGNLTTSSNAFGAPGDGILTAIDQFDAAGGDTPREILLIGDGAQGEGAAIGVLLPSLNPARVAITAIALGGRSDQPMLQSLARASAGSYHYVPVLAGGVDRAALDLAFDASHATQTREHVLLARQVGVAAGATVNETLPLDPLVVAPAGAAVFSAQVHSSTAPKPQSIRLFRPDGSEVLTGVGGPNGVEIIDTLRGRVFRIANAAVGNWQLQMVGGSAAPTGAVDLRVLLDEGRGPGGIISFARPDADESPLDVFQIGEPVDINYAKYILKDVIVSSVVASVERPDGSTVQVPLTPRLDRDGFSDSDADVFGARLDLQTLGSATNIADGPTAVAQRGSYRVQVRVRYGDDASNFEHIQSASFAVGDTSTDGDVDGLPDRYESAHVCLDPATSAFGSAGDPDGDGLSTADERLHGTDPCSVDTDEGGETDASEVAFGSNPLNGDDDALSAIPHAEIISQLSGHEEFVPLPALAHSIRFDSDVRYDQIVLKRAATAEGPFVAVATIDANTANGNIVDAGLSDGQQYCYQLLPRTSGGRVGAASDVFCGTARMDMTAPTGSLVLEDGAAQTRNAVITARIGFDNESAVGAQMNVQLPDGSETGWIPFQSLYPIAVSALTRPQQVLVSVLLRDASGNESERYADDIQLIEGDVAGDISGSVRGNGVALAQALVQIDNADTLAPAFSAANGDFVLNDLAPGNYTLLFMHLGYHDAVRSVVITGGKDQNLGIIEMEPISNVLFVDGFE